MTRFAEGSDTGQQRALVRAIFGLPAGDLEATCPRDGATTDHTTLRADTSCAVYVHTRRMWRIGELLAIRPRGAVWEGNVAWSDDDTTYIDWLPQQRIWRLTP